MASKTITSAQSALVKQLLAAGPLPVAVEQALNAWNTSATVTPAGGYSNDPAEAERQREAEKQRQTEGNRTEGSTAGAEARRAEEERKREQDQRRRT